MKPALSAIKDIFSVNNSRLHSFCNKPKCKAKLGQPLQYLMLVHTFSAFLLCIVYHFYLLTPVYRNYQTACFLWIHWLIFQPKKLHACPCQFQLWRRADMTEEMNVLHHIFKGNGLQNRLKYLPNKHISKYDQDVCPRQ